MRAKPQPIYRKALPTGAKGFQTYMMEVWERNGVFLQDGITRETFCNGNANDFAPACGGVRGEASDEHGDGPGHVWMWPNGSQAWIRDDGKEVVLLRTLFRDDEITAEYEGNP